MKRVGPLIVFAALWALGLVLLWPTDVPDDLRLPEVDLRRYFSSSDLERARDYETFLRVNTLLSTVVLVGVLALYARGGARFARESAAGRIGTGMLLGMLGLGLVWLAQLPFGLADLWWQRRHDVWKQDYVDWLVGSWLGLAGTFLFACFAIVIAMGLAGRFRDRWWLPAAPLLVGVGALVAFVSPYLVSPGLDPLRKPAIESDARRFERAQDLPHIPIEVEKVRKETRAANAQALGIGPSRRVVLWDTLLDRRFSRRQVDAVIAHELAHHSRDHIPEGIAWYALFALPATWAIAMLTRRRGGLYRPEAVPLALLLVVVLQLAATPLTNTLSRRVEAEADWVALQTTRDPAAVRALFRNFAKASLAEPDPPEWSSVLFGTHPTIEQRIAMADAWEARRRSALAVPGSGAGDSLRLTPARDREEP